MVTPESLQIVESIDVIQSIAMECFGQSCSLGMLIKDGSQDLDNRKVSLSCHVSGEKRGELLTETVGHLQHTIKWCVQ